MVLVLILIINCLLYSWNKKNPTIFRVVTGLHFSKEMQGRRKGSCTWEQDPNSVTAILSRFGQKTKPTLVDALRERTYPHSPHISDPGID